MAMISSITSLDRPPWKLRRQPNESRRAIWPTGGCTIRNTGTSNRLPTTRSRAKTFETAEIAGAGRNHDQNRRNDYAQRLRNTEEAERQADADEFGDDRQCVEQKEINDAEGAPEFAEALEDQPGMSDPGNRAEPQHHLLVDVEHRDQQRQRPQKGRAVVLAGLRIGTEGARIIVADHDDQPRSEDRQQCLQLGEPAVPSERCHPAGLSRARR